MRLNLPRAPTSAAALRRLRGAVLVDRQGELVWLGRLRTATAWLPGSARRWRQRHAAGATQA